MASCKPFEVQFSIEAESLYHKISDLMDKNNGQMSGDPSAGSFIVPVSSFGRVEGEYSISGSSIRLTITKRPRLLPCNMIESFFRKNLPRLEVSDTRVD
ncbi:hypothetical protein [Endozoicomonas sp. Mp262]|uniref:hypothetical protein n=1 Tax=Endozoicomonas sp. Mp262 TaxID=2919499 RepID=UPI0021D8DACB